MVAMACSAGDPGHGNDFVQCPIKPGVNDRDPGSRHSSGTIDDSRPRHNRGRSCRRWPHPDTSNWRTGSPDRG